MTSQPLTPVADDRDGSNAPRPVPALAAALHEAVAGVMRGHDELVRVALAAMLGGGHLLLEGAPGTGKTLLAKTLSRVRGGRLGRVQCTPDLLPADLTGANVYSPATGSFTFVPGPLFADVVLLDEVNRASPRTQAALLEPMEERQITVDGVTHVLPSPYFVIATQNPLGATGTFPLPESQLDRFLMSAPVAVTDRASELAVLAGQGGVEALDALVAITSGPELAAATDAVARLHCAPPLLGYVLDIVEATRAHRDVVQGASTRAAQALLRAARAMAVLSGRDHVVPDDVQAVSGAVLAHRLVLTRGPDMAIARALVEGIVAEVPVPRP